MHFRLVIASLACFACLLVTTGTAPGQWPPRSRLIQFTYTANYFPLAVGNSWTYAVEGRFASGDVAVQVTEAVEVEGRQYFVLEGYTPQPALVRLTSQGRLVELRRASGTEHLWYDFTAVEGTIWTSELPHPCLGEAKLASRRSEVETPRGSTNNGLVIRYGPTNCADAGIQEEAFAPGIGLVRRTELTIAGPRSLVLTEARIDGKIISSPSVSFTLSIDQPVYFPNLMPPVTPERAVPTMQARMTIRNSTDFPLRLEFPSGQRFDLAIRNKAGERVYVWSQDKLFTQAVGVLDLSPGERTFTVNVPLGRGENQAFPPGSYLVEAWLTTTDPDFYGARVSFEMNEPVF